MTTLWRLTTATVPWFWCRSCNEPIPHMTLAGSRTGDSDTWICVSCLGSTVLAEDIDEIPNHNTNTDKEG